MQNTILYTTFFILSFLLSSCSLDEIRKKQFMNECNANGDIEKYCECVFEKIYDKYHNNWKEVESIDVEGEEFVKWCEDCFIYLPENFK